MPVNEYDMAQNVASGPLWVERHVVVAFDFMCYYGLEDVEKVKYKCARGDYETMDEEIKGVNWDGEFYGKDVNGLW